MCCRCCTGSCQFTQVWTSGPLTSEVSVDLNVLLSYTHPLWHGTVGIGETSEEFSNSRWYWGSANIWQECNVPSCWTGMLTSSFSRWDKFLKAPPSSRELMSQWWEGMAAMKLFRKKLQGIGKHPMNPKTMIIFWNLPNPFIRCRMFSNFILSPSIQCLSFTEKNIYASPASVKVEWRNEWKPEFGTASCKSEVEIGEYFLTVG